MYVSAESQVSDRVPTTVRVERTSRRRWVTLLSCLRQVVGTLAGFCMIKLLDCEIAGASYYASYYMPEELPQEGDAVELVREPTNVHDPLAIAVWYNETQLGHLPKHVSRVLAPLIDGGYHVVAFVEDNLFDDIFLELLFESKHARRF